MIFVKDEAIKAEIRPRGKNETQIRLEVPDQQLFKGNQFMIDSRHFDSNKNMYVMLIGNDDPHNRWSASMKMGYNKLYWLLTVRYPIAWMYGISRI